MSGELQEEEYPVSLKSNKAIEATWYAIVLWIVGFVWSMTVYMIPALKNMSSISHISKLPAVSVVLLSLYLVMLWYLADATWPRPIGDKLKVSS